MTLSEVEILMRELNKHINEQTQLLFGTAVDGRMGDRLSVTLISSLAADEVEVAPRKVKAHAALPSVPPAPESIIEAAPEPQIVPFSQPQATERGTAIEPEPAVFQHEEVVPEPLVEDVSPPPSPAIAKRPCTPHTCRRPARCGGARRCARGSSTTLGPLEKMRRWLAGAQISSSVADPRGVAGWTRSPRDGRGRAVWRKGVHWTWRSSSSRHSGSAAW